MHKTPQSEDEQSEHVPQRRRRQVTPPQRLQLERGSDEYPEVPKIRRASRFLDQQNLQSAPDLVEEENEQEVDVEEQEHRPRARPPRQDTKNTSRIMVAHRRHPYVSPAYTPPPPPARHTR